LFLAERRTLVLLPFRAEAWRQTYARRPVRTSQTGESARLGGMRGSYLAGEGAGPESDLLSALPLEAFVPELPFFVDFPGDPDFL
jgi:hypothetical protein